MKYKPVTFNTSLLSALLIGSTAIADEMMDTAQLSALISGNTLYVEIPAGAPGAPDGGTAPIYYGADGSAAAQLPAGLKLLGKWRLEQDAYCIDWENGPQNSCTQIIREESAFVAMDAKLGKPRGLVRQIVTGNAENL